MSSLPTITQPPQTPVIEDLPRHRLLKLLRPLCATSRADAAGRCLGLSLDAAQLAKDQLGLDLSLLRWQVRDEVDYMEHWAVELGPAHALDMTHMQVDGRATLLVQVDSYPANFTNCRRYAAAPLLAMYRQPGSTQADRLGTRFLLGSRLHIFGHDMRLAWQQ